MPWIAAPTAKRRLFWPKRPLRRGGGRCHAAQTGRIEFHPAVAQPENPHARHHPQRQSLGGRDAGTAGGLGCPHRCTLPGLHCGLRQQLRWGAAEGRDRLSRET